MPLTSRRPRPLPRNVDYVRDFRLFIVATEDTHAPKQYLEFFPHPRIHVKVLATQNGFSSPQDVIRRLDEYQTEFQIGDEDQLWALLDTDHWIKGNHRPGLIDALNRARQQGYRVAMSNPCFDLWLMLHRVGVAPGTVFAGCSAVTEALHEAGEEFNKTKLKAEHYSPDRVASAVARARALEPSGIDPHRDFWPTNAGSRVYLLVDELRRAGLGFGGVPGA